MYTYKSSSIFAVVISLFLLSFALLQPLQTSAQTTYTCQLEGDLSVGLATDFTDEVEDFLPVSVSVNNSSDYHMAGVGVMVGFFESADSVVPSYVSVLSADETIYANSNREVVANVGLEALPAGSYDVRAVAFQGDGTDLLGALISGTENSTSITKTEPANSDLAYALTINGQAVAANDEVSIENGQNISATLRASNNGPIPVLDTPVYVSISQGSLPLGTAVRSEVSDMARLIPGGYRDTMVTDNFVQDGLYTVYGFMDRGRVATPVMTSAIQAGDGTGAGSWMYISKVGVSAVPLSSEDHITACVENIGTNAGSAVLHQEAGVMFSLSVEGADVFSETVFNEQVADMTFVVNPGKDIGDFNLTATLLEKRFQGQVFNPEDAESNETEDSSYTVTQAVSGAYNCPDENCGNSRALAPDPSEVFITRHVEPYWFYIGIMLAAALLLYFMLRRLHPEDTGAPTAVADEELQ